jgi:hypothetical protein
MKTYQVVIEHGEFDREVVEYVTVEADNGTDACDKVLEKFPDATIVDYDDGEGDLT